MLVFCLVKIHFLGSIQKLLTHLAISQKCYSPFCHFMTLVPFTECVGGTLIHEKVGGCIAPIICIHCLKYNLTIHPYS